MKLTSVDRMKLLPEIFMTFFKLGCIGFGGGYAIIPLMEREIVDNKGWLDKEKMVDIMAISGTLPGAIALNTSAFVGYSVAGVPGALAALVGNLTPSVFIVLGLIMLFLKFCTYPLVKSAFKGIYPAISALILYAAYKTGKTALKDATCLVIMLLAFCGAMCMRLPLIPIIIAGAAAGIAVTSARYMLSGPGRKTTAKGGE